MNIWLFSTLKVVRLFGMLLIVSFSLFSEPLILNGEQEGSYPAGEYLITEGTVVPKGKTMILKPGTVLKFESYSGLKISGSLTCRGNSLNSIVFTSREKNMEKEGEPFSSWNGIIVDSGASVELERVEIFNSVYGLRVDPDVKEVKLKDVLFKNNNEDFTFGDSLVQVDNNSLYSGEFNVAEEVALDDRYNFERRFDKKKHKSGKKITLQVSLGGIVAACAALTVVNHLKYEDYYEKYDASEDSSSVLKYRKKVDSHFVQRNVFAGIGGAALTGLVFTFFF